IANTYSNTYATAANSWNVPDMTIPANSIEDILVIGRDGTGADSLGCEELVNSEEITGHIAMIYRGTCPFGTKALNAQNAGAIGVLLISNGDDLAITMLGGDDGPNVNIPVVMISQSSGAIIRPVLDAEEVTAFIGNNFGAFEYNLNIDRYDLLVPSASQVPPVLAMDASEYQVDLGAFIHNFGSEMQSSARLRAVVTMEGNELYNEVSDNQTLFPGDSLFVELPQFNQPGYDGSYAITYSVESDNEEGAPNDNTYSIPLKFGDVFTYVPVANGIPVSENHVVPAEPSGAFRTCIQFSDTNASRLTATGVYFSATTPNDEVDPQDSVLTDLLVIVQAYLWLDPIDNAFTLPTSSGLASLTVGTYSFPDNLQGEHVFIPFEDVLELEDDARYLVCVETSDPFVRHGWNETVDYTTNAQFFNEPTSMIQNGADWFNGFSGLAGSPSIGLLTVNPFAGVVDNGNQVTVTPFPNPTNDVVRIPMKGFSGAGLLQMFDVNGAKVAERNITVGADNAMVVDVNGISAGTYLFHMEFQNGQRSDFRVVVTK
ncbi:MAG: hypothetical protein KDC00_10610, partial [Flavobacteriales bacterium]|nr:hypothetical protein [Flavobacteriales bacterium]